MALVVGANLQRPVFFKEPTIAPPGTWKREDKAEAYMLMRPSALHRLAR